MAKKNKHKKKRKNTMPKHEVKPLNDAEFEALVKKHDTEGGALAQAGARQAQGCWDSGIKIIQQCGHMVIPEYLIHFSQLAHEKIECLKRSYPSLEWLAYLEGRVEHGTKEVFVDNLIIPDSQVVTGGHVGEVEYGWNEGKAICGVIHSHNTMGAFFSGTDDAYINQNHDVSICVSTARGREICGQVRVKTPCGSYIINSNVKFKVDYSNVLDEEAFVAEFKPRIRTPRVIFSGGRQAPTSGKGVQGGNHARGGQPTTSGTESAVRPVHAAEDPYKMDKATLNEELLVFHTQEDIDNMMECGTDLSYELEQCYTALGYDIMDEDGDIVHYEEDEGTVVLADTDTDLDDLVGELNAECPQSAEQTDGWDTDESKMIDFEKPTSDPMLANPPEKAIESPVKLVQ